MSSGKQNIVLIHMNSKFQDLKKEILYATYILWGNVRTRKLTFCYLFLLGWECYHRVHKQNSDHLKQKNPTTTITTNPTITKWLEMTKIFLGIKKKEEKISQLFQIRRDAIYSFSQLMKAKCYLLMSLLNLSSKINEYIFI